MALVLVVVVLLGVVQVVSLRPLFFSFLHVSLSLSLSLIRYHILFLAPATGNMFGANAGAGRGAFGAKPGFCGIITCLDDQILSHGQVTS